MRKRVVFICLVFTAIALLCSCQSKDPTNGKTPQPNDIAAEIVEKGEFPEMLEMDVDIVQRKYSLDRALLEDCSVYICSSGAQADEVAVFKAADAGAAKKIKKSVEKRAETIYTDFVDYVPGEIPKVDDHIIIVKGSYVFFVIAAQPKSAQQIFERYFN